MSKSIAIDPAIRSLKNKAEYTVDLWIEGYNCSECIVMAFAGEFGLELDMAARIATGFGFNAGREKEKTCGVVTGAIMLIGLKYGAGLKRDPYSKDLCTFVTHEFINRFIARRKSVACKKIHRTYKHPEKIRTLTGENAFCAKVTQDAAVILEVLFADQHL